MQLKLKLTDVLQYLDCNCNLFHIQVDLRPGQIQPQDTECVIISENVPDIYRKKSVINTIKMIIQ
jgi:hypothetical protein